MILDDIVYKRKLQLEKEKLKISLEQMKELAENNKREAGRFFNALSGDEMSFICEVKKASPSKGVISRNFKPLENAISYEKAGAAAISCLTEEHYFMGSIKYLEEIAQNTSIPVLRKDFIFDVYQIYEAAARGAGAVLLIAAILNAEQLEKFIETAKCVGLDCLVEVHNEEELENVLNTNAEIIGINNRDLRTFEVSLDTTERLAKFVPREKILVSESGIKTAEDVKKLYDCGARAVLIGETMMRSGNIYDTLNSLRRF